MTESEVQERRAYIQAVRDSFSDASSHTASRQPYTWEEKEEEVVGRRAFWKLRLLLSIMLFAAFVLSDRTKTPFFSLTADTLTDKICENQLLSDTFDSFRHLLVEK